MGPKIRGLVAFLRGHLSRPSTVAALLVAAGILALAGFVAWREGGRGHLNPTVSLATPSPSAEVSPTPTDQPSPSAEATTPPTTSPSHSSTSTAASVRHCTASDVSLSLRTDRSSYVQGDDVDFQMRVTNHSASTCNIDEGDANVPIFDSSNQPLFRFPPGVYLHPSPYTSQYTYELDPGETSPQYDCIWHKTELWQGDRAAPGTYHATGAWSYPQLTTPAVYFQVTAASPAPSPSPSPSPTPTPSLLP